ncbi:hypothetical protein [Bacillus infantis]|uniref:hypothetical protein n=1 Tax=Bacillus infantis TaxID=324767 RepID=UPI003CF71F62
MEVVSDLQRFEEIKHEMVTVPGGFDDYYFHIEKQLLFSKVSNRFLLTNAKGTGDDNKYLGTSLKNKDGKSYNFYLHEISYACKTGIPKKVWRSLPVPLEVDHLYRETKNNDPKFLTLKTSKENKANKIFTYNKIRLSKDIALKLREEFKSVNWGEKITWYSKKAQELGVTKRSIQNVVLGYTYKQAN